MTLALNKSALKQQRDQLGLYRKFLPSLDLKRQQLQTALKESRATLLTIEKEMQQLDQWIEPLYPVLGSDIGIEQELSSLIRVQSIDIETENLAGVHLPVFRELNFEATTISTLATPFWIDQLMEGLRKMAELRVRHEVQRRRSERLELASRRVTQRVNLFEKVLIPQSQEDIKRIQIFLADQERSAVVRSKIAKARA